MGDEACDVDEEIGDDSVTLTFASMVNGQTYKYLNFWDSPADGGDDPAPWREDENTPASLFALDKIFANIVDGTVVASIGLVKSANEEKSGYYALCPTTASLSATQCGDLVCTQTVDGERECEDECADARRRRRRMPEEASDGSEDSDDSDEEEEEEAVVYNIGRYC